VTIIAFLVFDIKRPCGGLCPPRSRALLGGSVAPPALCRAAKAPWNTVRHSIGVP